MDNFNYEQHEFNKKNSKSMSIDEASKQFTKEAIERLTINMDEAVEKENYERAAEIRDEIKHIQELHDEAFNNYNSNE